MSRPAIPRNVPYTVRHDLTNSVSMAATTPTGATRPPARPPTSPRMKTTRLGRLLAVEDRGGAPSVLHTAVSPAGPVCVVVLIDVGSTPRDRPHPEARI